MKLKKLPGFSLGLIALAVGNAYATQLLDDYSIISYMTDEESPIEIKDNNPISNGEYLTTEDESHAVKVDDGVTGYINTPKTAVWFIKPRNTVIGCGEPIPFPQGEKVLSGATVALIVGKTATKVREEDAAEYIAGYALANDVSLPEESFYRPAIKAKCRDGFCPIGETVALKEIAKTFLSSNVMRNET